MATSRRSPGADQATADPAPLWPDTPLLVPSMTRHRKTRADSSHYRMEREKALRMAIVPPVRAGRGQRDMGDRPRDSGPHYYAKSFCLDFARRPGAHGFGANIYDHDGGGRRFAAHADGGDVRRGVANRGYHGLGGEYILRLHPSRLQGRFDRNAHARGRRSQRHWHAGRRRSGDLTPAPPP